MSALALATGGLGSGTEAATLGLNPDNPTPLAGQAVTFTVLVTPPASGDAAPTGTVQFEVDGSAVGTAVALANEMATSDSVTLTAGRTRSSRSTRGTRHMRGLPGRSR